jgi:hypothetical protein
VASRKSRAEYSIGRRHPTREPKQRILVVCEGSVTEPKYFKSLAQLSRNPRLHVEVARETGVPLAVVKIACSKRREAEKDAKEQHDDNLLWDQVWGVFDIDEHPRLDEAKRLAVEYSVQIAVSNPCFELWALLHFRDQRAYIERRHLRAALRMHLPGYEKVLDLKRMHPGYETAVERAKALEREAEEQGCAGRNPTTGVFRLTEAILKA